MSIRDALRKLNVTMPQPIVRTKAIRRVKLVTPSRCPVCNRPEHECNLAWTEEAHKKAGIEIDADEY